MKFIQKRRKRLCVRKSNPVPAKIIGNGILDWEQEHGIISHCVFAFGYAKSNTSTDYLFVMDGWNTGGKFVQYDYYDWVSGYKIYVRE